MEFVKSNRYLILFLLFVFVIFSPFLLRGKIPLPADDLIGLYHPWRDALHDQYPNGIPFKNPLITDPIRQQFPYRMLAIEQIKKGQLPVWNPYNFAGTPLLANIQTAAFYPLNLIFWLLSPVNAWSVLVLLQPLLAGLFMYRYLLFLKLDKRAAFIGSVAFAFSGFMVAWLEWNTIGHVALWLPLILLAKDQLILRRTLKWVAILVFAEVSMLLAGHLQTSFYILIFSSVYLVLRLFQKVRHGPLSALKNYWIFAVTGLAVLFITSIQLLYTGEFILASARAFDLPSWQRSDWFIPWQHALQFIAPDFFGNPATGNYWGVWNYGEFVGYVGLIPLLFAVYALFYRRDKKTFFYGLFLFISLFLAFPTSIGKIPYLLGIPLLSTLQPSRILVLVDFCLAVLAALGLDYLICRYKEHKITQLLMSFVPIIGGFIVILSFCWISVLARNILNLGPFFTLNGLTAQKNLILPTILLIVFMFYVLILVKLQKKHILELATLILLIFVLADLVRFTTKFTPFTDVAYLYPGTKTIKFLKTNLGFHRYMTTDRRLIPPNVATLYQLSSIDGYDPLYLNKYAELVAIWTRNRADITPAAFNRILTPEDYQSFITDLLGVKYVLSLRDLTDPKLQLVLQEGETRVYENTQVYPRAYLAEKIISIADTQNLIENIFSQRNSLKTVAFVKNPLTLTSDKLSQQEKVTIQQYNPNTISMDVTTTEERLVVLTDIIAPGWRVYVDKIPAQLIEVNYFFRGVVVPAGKHVVKMHI